MEYINGNNAISYPAFSGEGFASRLNYALSRNNCSLVTACKHAQVDAPLMLLVLEGQADPTARQISKLADALGVNPAWLAFGIGEQNLPTVDELARCFAEDILLSADQLDEKYSPDGDGEHPWFTREHWSQAVRSGHTIVGYWQWLSYRLASLGKP